MFNVSDPSNFQWVGKKKHKEKMLNEKLLNLEHKKLYLFLINLFNEKKNCIDCFLHEEYRYGACDWYSGETWSIGLGYSWRYDEIVQLDKKEDIGEFD